MAKTILNFHLDYWNPSLMSAEEVMKICVNTTLQDDCITQSIIHLPVRSAALLGVHTWSSEKINCRFSA